MKQILLHLSAIPIPSLLATLVCAFGLTAYKKYSLPKLFNRARIA